MSTISLKKERSKNESLSMSDPNYNPKYQPKEKVESGITPTVITDTSVRDEVPNINAKANKLTETGRFYDTFGNQRNADGSLVDEDIRDDEITTLNAEADKIDDGVDKILKDLYKQTDADSARQISAIQAQYDVREQQLKEINRRNELGTDTALLLGGSSRYTVSSNGLSAAQVKHGIMELAQLDAMEQSAIAEVKQAQSEQNFRIAEKAIEKLEKMRTEKISKAQKLAESLAAENNEIRKNMQKLDQEQAVANLFQQGITDPADLQTELKKSGYNIGLSDITNLLKIIDPAEDLAGLTADYKTYRALREKGEIPDNWDYFDFQAASANAKRKPTSGKGGEDEILDYDSWKDTAEAQKLLEDQMNKEAMSFTPEAADEFLQKVYKQSVRELKKSSVDADKNYTSSNIPSDIKNDLIADINSEADIRDIYEAYPDVSTSYISSLYNSLTKKKKTTTDDASSLSDEEFYQLLSEG